MASPRRSARSSLARAPVATRTRSAAIRSPDTSATPVARPSPSIAASRAPSRMSTPRERCSASKKPDTASPATRFITRSSASTTIASRPFLAKHGRDLEPDIAAADDGDAPRVIERRPQPAHVVDLAQREHAGKLDAGQRQIARAGAGREHQRLVVEAAAVAEADTPVRQIDRGGRRAQIEARHLVVGPVAPRGAAAGCRPQAAPSGRPWTTAAAGRAHKARRRPCGSAPS